MKLDLIIVGVGGQGILLTSRVLGELALAWGADAKVSEVHGMSQRGGDVITHVRIGENVQSPLVETGKADALLAFEPMEAERAAKFLKPHGVLIVNTREIAPAAVLSGAIAYPADILPSLGERFTVTALDAQALADAVEAPRAVNMVLLGAFAKCWGGDDATFMEAMDRVVPKKSIESNRRAFRAGWEAV